MFSHETSSASRTLALSLCVYMQTLALYIRGLFFFCVCLYSQSFCLSDHVSVCVSVCRSSSTQSTYLLYLQYQQITSNPAKNLLQHMTWTCVNFPKLQFLESRGCNFPVLHPFIKHHVQLQYTGNSDRTLMLMVSNGNVQYYPGQWFCL